VKINPVHRTIYSAFCTSSASAAAGAFKSTNAQAVAARGGHCESLWLDAIVLCVSCFFVGKSGDQS